MHDTAPIDIALTAGYIAAIGSVLRVCLAVPPATKTRLVWIGVAVLLLSLLANQQSDSHARLLRLGARFSSDIGVSTVSPVTRIVGGLLLGFTALAVVWALARLHRRGHSLGVLVSLALLMIAAHAIGRGLTLLHVVSDPSWEQGWLLALKLVEGIGLILMTVGAWRWLSLVRRREAPMVQMGDCP